MSNLTNATESHYHHPSYAQAAAHNAPPSSAQPHPDKNLLYTGPSPTHPTTAPDLDTKVSVVPHDWAAHPTTETSLHISITHSPTDTDSDDDDNQGANLNRRPKSNVRKQREKRKGNTCKSKREFSTSPPFTPRLFIPGLVTFRPSSIHSFLIRCTQLIYIPRSQPRCPFQHRIYTLRSSARTHESPLPLLVRLGCLRTPLSRGSHRSTIPRQSIWPPDSTGTASFPNLPAIGTLILHPTPILTGNRYPQAKVQGNHSPSSRLRPPPRGFKSYRPCYLELVRI